MFRYLIVLVVLITSIYAKDGWVEATGYGNTKDEALKSAFSDAVSQYIGVVVDSKSLAKNGKLIEDKILTFSNGYIGNYKILNASQRAGLWQVKIKALVKEQKILNKIKQEKISIENITNSKQRYAKLVSQIKTKFDAEDIFVEKMKTLLSWDTTKKYNQPKITYFYIDEDGATRKYVPVKIKVQKTLNKYVYNNILDDLRHLFKQLGGKKVSRTDAFTSIKMCTKWKYKYYHYGFDCDNKYEYWQFPNSYKVIYPFINKYEDNGKGWFIFMKDGEDKTVVYPYEDFYKHYVINFLDKNGKVLKSIEKTKKINTYYDYIFHKYASIMVFYDVNEIIFDETIKLPLKLFRDLSRVEVKWVD